MANQLKKFNAGSLDIGVDTFNPDFTGTLALARATSNMTSGINQGIGVRYGITPIPGQADTETVADPRSNGLMKSEGPSLGPGLDNGLTGRRRAFRILAIKLRHLNAMTGGNQTFTNDYDQILFLVAGSAGYIDAVPQVYYAAGDYSYTAELSQGWMRSSGITPSAFTGLGVPRGSLAVDLSEADAAQGANTQRFFAYNSEKFYASSASYSHPSKKIPCKWMFGEARGDGDATHAPDAMFFNTPSGTIASGTLFGGAVSCMSIPDMDTNSRGVEVYTLTTGSVLNIQYSYSVNLASISNLYCKITSGDADIKFQSGGAAAVKVTSGTTYTSNDFVLMNDPLMFNDSSYSAIFIIGDNPIMMIVQEWIKNYGGAFQQKQYVDLTKDLQRPRTLSQAKQTQIASGDRYSEDGTVKNSAFLKFPKFVRGTPMAAISADGTKLGAVDTGILLKDRVYEITYSYYNKRFDFESNVGDPVKIQTDANDNVCIVLGGATGSDTNLQHFRLWAAGGAGSPPIWYNFYGAPFIGNEGNGAVPYLNTTEIRFYYREEGTFEWLPAGNFDAAEYWLRPNPDSFCRICSGATAGLPGGQPGGFNDYSPLPKNPYNSVLVFQNRTFWVSPKSINFSLRDNPFAYSLRNTVTIQSGEFVGAIVHNFPGQAEQTSRLIMFATNAIYVGRFTGQPATAAVQVSPDSVGEYPLDGSDFTADLWTTVTSFSHRSACVAEGYLYYWGPQGIFRDNGTENPTRISIQIEPDIFSCYDKTKTDQIFCIYNNQTQEIIWFYSPTEEPTLSYAWVYNLTDQKFLPQKFTCKIDDASNVSLTGDNSATFGQERTIISTRASDEEDIQRMYFFDYLNRSGDMTNDTQLMVKTVSTPVAGQRRFTLAAGSAALTPVNVGDNICIQQLDKYWPATTGEDLIGTVSAVNVGSSYVDVILPDGAAFDAAAALTYDNFFPIMHSGNDTVGLNGFEWTMESKYWMPSGINGFLYFLYFYLLFKYHPLPKTKENYFEIGYRTPSGADFISDELRFVDNSDGNFQLYYPLLEGESNNQGQAIKIRLSGIHIGEEWVLQYLETHATEQTGNILKQYEPTLRE